MKRTGVIIDIKGGAIKDANYGMVACAGKGETELHVFIIKRVDEKIECEAYKRELEKYGVKKIVEVTIESDDKGNSNPLDWSDALVQALTAYEISTLFGLTDPLGKELLPRIAAELGAPLVMDCIDVSSDHDLAKTFLYSGKTLATIKVTGDIRLFGIRPNVINPSSEQEMALAAEPSLPQQSVTPQKSATVESFIAPKRQQSNISLVESRAGDGSGNDLLAADLIISGGRAMKNRDNFKLLHDCAETIGNMGAVTAVGASRVAVDLGWVPYRMQVGQTGEKVSPKVYIACGISGSVQHFAGMKMSGVIISINENPNAAIMSNCDYFVEADLFTILPALTKELKKYGKHG